MGIYVKFTKNTHQIGSCHVTLASNSENFYFSPYSILKVHVPNFEGVSGSEDRGGVRTVSNSLNLGGWVTNVLKKATKNWGGGGVQGWVTTVF